MKCRICGNRAQIELRAHNIALCKDDFFRFFERRLERTIEEYELFSKGDRIAVAVSGGKDSLALMYALKNLGLDITGIYVNLGIGEYSEISQEKCRNFAASFNSEVYSFSVKDFFGKNIKELSMLARRNSCSLCGIIKRYVMNRFGIEKGFNTLATGHNLDDESAALFGNLVNFDLSYLSKEKIALQAKEKSLKKVKPFSLLSEREVAAYALMRGIDYIYDECPFSKGATSMNYKSALNLIEEKSPGTKQRFFKKFMENAELFKPQIPNSKSQIPKSETKKPDDEIIYCQDCGYLTYREKCNFCAVAEKSSVAEKVRGDFLDYCVKLGA